MNEANVQAKEIASAVVKVGNEECKLILTENYVTMHSKKMIFREATTLIPLGSIDSIFHGWQRYAALLIIGIVFGLGGLLMTGQGTSGGGFALFLATGFLVAFWFYRPHLLLVRSSREALGGNPVSAPESQKFIAAVTELLSRSER